MECATWFLIGTILLFQVSSKGFASKVCYEPFDCFTDESPFTSPVKGHRFLPLRRDIINVTYGLFVRHEQPYIRNIDFKTINISGPYSKSYRAELDDTWRELLIATKPTKFIIHDYDDTGSSAWVYAMAEKFLAEEDCHVISVDWKSPNRRYGFERATANGRLVGAEISLLLDNIKTIKPQFDFETVHILGHGIGAHIASYVGQHFKVNDVECEAERDDSGSWWQLSSWTKSSNSESECPKKPRIGQITGLDPAGRWYEEAGIEARLDSSDAIFVDVIHTDVTERTMSYVGNGIKRECGHVDLYPNGGFLQPGCKGKVSGLEGILYPRSSGPLRQMNCNHLRSISYYLSTIDPDSCPLTSYPCKRWNDFIDGKCTSCVEEDDESDGYSLSGLLSYVGITQDTGNTRSCLQLGPSARNYWTEHVEASENEGIAPRNVKAYMKTTDNSPYCVNYIRVELELAEEWSEGALSFRFTNRVNQRTDLIKAGRVSNWGSTSNPTYLLTVPSNFAHVTEVSVVWELEDAKSWFPGVLGGSRGTRRELRLPVTKVKISEAPSNEMKDFCTTRRRLRSRKETRFTSCYARK